MEDFEIIGKGKVGDKVRQLMNKSPKLKEIGFCVPKRTVLAESFFDKFLQRNKLGDNLRDVEVTDDLEDRIKRGTLTGDQFEVLQKVSNSYGAMPLVVRSSAEGDARGTGTYKSVFTENKIGQVIKSVREVLTSYFSEDTVAFRRDAETGEGFGEIIEPIIGQEIDWVFAPILSGFGYTSTSKGEGYMNIVPGLGGGVETRDGEKITKDMLRPFNGNLDDYIWDVRDSENPFNLGNREKTALINMKYNSYNGFSFKGQAYVPPNRFDRGMVGKGLDLRFEKAGIIKAFEGLNLNPLFEMIRKMEDSFERPQYFEWAMTLDKGEPKYWINQIADANKKLDRLDFDDLGETIFMAHTVTGTGKNLCRKIANCFNPSNVGALYEFNKKNKDYLLIFSSRLTSNLGDNIRIGYRHFSNASAFLEIQDARHCDNPVDHLGGQLDMTGKLFGVLDYKAEVKPQWNKIKSGKVDEGGIDIYQGDFSVVASERQDKMVVFR